MKTTALFFTSKLIGPSDPQTSIKVGLYNIQCEREGGTSALGFQARHFQLLSKLTDVSCGDQAPPPISLYYDGRRHPIQ